MRLAMLHRDHVLLLRGFCALIRTAAQARSPVSAYGHPVTPVRGRVVSLPPPSPPSSPSPSSRARPLTPGTLSFTLREDVFIDIDTEGNVFHSTSPEHSGRVRTPHSDLYDSWM